MSETESPHIQFDTVAGMRIESLVAGAGQPLVLLHGDGESAFDWTWVAPRLASQYRVFAPNLPGYGDSDKPDVHYTIDFYHSFLKDYLSTLGLERVLLVGNSMGGLIALSLALTEPESVAALALVDSAGLGRALSPILAAQALPAAGELIMAWSKTPLGAMQLAWSRASLLFANPLQAPASWIREQERLAEMPGCLRATISSLRNDLCFGLQCILKLNDLERLSMPVKVIWGQQDRILPLYQAFAAAGRAGQGPPAVISGAGHIPHVESPDAFLAALMPFLRAHAPAISLPA